MISIIVACLLFVTMVGISSLLCCGCLLVDTLEQGVCVNADIEMDSRNLGNTPTGGL
jgi:hypothetical protein